MVSTHAPYQREAPTSLKKLGLLVKDYPSSRRRGTRPFRQALDNHRYRFG